MTGNNGGSWPRARLIPVTGIGSQKEAETRAASAVLAVLSIVRGLSVELFSAMGATRATKATVETYTEPQFAMGEKKLRPDGIVRISFGQATWQALIEVKTGSSPLDADQVNAYWDLARSAGFDAVVTISNEIAPGPDTHPTDGLKVKSNSKVKVHHISWTALLSAAVMMKVHHGVEDPEQAWLLGELIRYLEHPASGAMAFDDMGPHWTTVRDAARDGGLHRSDDAVRAIAVRWDQLLRYAALQLGARIGEDVQQTFSRGHLDARNRSAYLIEAICAQDSLDGALRVPHTAGDLHISADLKAKRLAACLTVAAPDDRGARGRCGWLMNQLKGAPGTLIIEAYPKNARMPNTATLSDARESRDLLLDDKKRNPIRFRIIQQADMGQSRKAGGRTPGFIDSVTGMIEGFYGSVVQNVSRWSPPAPKMGQAAEPPSTDGLSGSTAEAHERVDGHDD